MITATAEVEHVAADDESFKSFQIFLLRGLSVKALYCLRGAPSTWVIESPVYFIIMGDNLSISPPH